MTLNWLDILLIVLVGGSAAAGLVKGFARVGVGFAATIAGLLLGIWFYGTAGYYLLPYLSSRGLANFIGFWIVFLGCMIAGGVLGKGLGKLFRWAGLGWMDRLLGALFGLLRGLVVAIALVLALIAFSPKPPPVSVVHSQWAPYLVGAADMLAELAPRELRDAFYSSYDKVKEVWSQALRKSKELPETGI